MSRVSFAEGTTASDSPSKLFNHSAPHSSTKYDLNKRRGELRFNMHRKNTVIPHEDFMTRFLPKPPTRTGTRSAEKSGLNIFADLPKPSNEDEMYDSLPDRLNKAGICPDHTFVATPRKRDKADLTKQSVDLGMYPSSIAPKPPADGSHARMDWSAVDVPMECKDHPTEEDPFDDDAADGLATATTRKAAHGQLLSYAELVYRYQQRTHVYVILLLGDFARIVRFDHSGLFATKKFNYKVEGEKLTGFLWRFSRMTRAERGHDPTAARIPHNSTLGKAMRDMAEPPEVVDQQRDYIRLAFQNSLDRKWPWWRLEVPVVENEGTPEETHSVRRFVVGKPHFQAPGIAGRATRGYVALPLTAKGVPEGPFVYLKDAWRVDRVGIEREGSTLKELNDLEIKYVPTLVCHGDIPGQVTVSQDVWPDYHPQGQECPLKRHQHYRLVVKEVGKPLEMFENGYQLVYALLCCIDAHQAAHIAGIIHRDISGGNILLWYDPEEGWQGMLNDWELAKKVPAADAVSGGRQPDRTGTWQFMSAHALNDRFRPIIIPDELEAFLHVLLYYAIRFLSHNCSAVGKFLQLYFDDYTDGLNGQFNCGQMKYFAMKSGEIDLRLLSGKTDEEKAKETTQEPGPAAEPLRFHKPGSTTDHPIQTIMETLLRWFAAYYALDKAKAKAKDTQPDDTGSVPGDSDKIEVPKGLLAMFDDDEDDESASDLPDTPSTTASEQKAATFDPNAEKVQTHQAMRKLLLRELRKPDNWPPKDKGVDKRPKHGYEHPKDAVPAVSTLLTGATRSTGTKRQADPEPTTPKKRSKV